MTPCGTYRVPLGVSAVAMIPACDVWNRGETVMFHFLSPPPKYFEPLSNHHEEVNCRTKCTCVFLWTRRFISKCYLKNSSSPGTCSEANVKKNFDSLCFAPKKHPCLEEQKKCNEFFNRSPCGDFIGVQIFRNWGLQTKYHFHHCSKDCRSESRCTQTPLGALYKLHMVSFHSAIMRCFWPKKLPDCTLGFSASTDAT